MLRALGGPSDVLGSFDCGYLKQKNTLKAQRAALSALPGSHHDR